MNRQDANRLLDGLEFAFERHMAVQHGQFDFTMTPDFMQLIQEHIAQIRAAVNRQNSE